MDWNRIGVDRGFLDWQEFKLKKKGGGSTDPSLFQKTYLIRENYTPYYEKKGGTNHVYDDNFGDSIRRSCCSNDLTLYMVKRMESNKDSFLSRKIHSVLWKEWFK